MTWFFLAAFLSQARPTAAPEPIVTFANRAGTTIAVVTWEGDCFKVDDGVRRPRPGEWCWRLYRDMTIWVPEDK